MEYERFGPLDFQVSKIGLGTWITGGWLRQDVKAEESLGAVEAAIGAGVTLIDTAPVYGFGRSEEIVGKVIIKSNQ